VSLRITSVRCGSQSFKNNDDRVRIHRLSDLYKDLSYYRSRVGCNAMFHLHCLDDHQCLSGDNVITGAHLNNGDSSRYRSGRALGCSFTTAGTFESG
jgi:hypothetical protein